MKTMIGFIGLGHMGNPMVQNLIKAGYQLQVYDAIPQAAEALVQYGAIATHSLAEVANNADVIMTSVQTGKQVNDICLTPDGIFKNAKSNLLFLDCSSIDITMTKSLHQEAERAGISMLDTPVSGGVAAANAATLTIMAGGSEKDFKRAEPILKSIGKKVIHAGPAGHGQAAKICNNLLLAISMIGVCEAFSLAKKLGLDQKKFFDISSNASGQCWSMTSYCPVPGILENVPANNDYKPGFMAKMMLKDLRLGQHAAESVNSSIPLGAVSTELYELFVNQGHGEMDFSAIINMIEKQ